MKPSSKGCPSPAFSGEGMLRCSSQQHKNNEENNPCPPLLPKLPRASLEIFLVDRRKLSIERFLGLYPTCLHSNGEAGDFLQIIVDDHFENRLLVDVPMNGGTPKFFIEWDGQTNIEMEHESDLFDDLIAHINVSAAARTSHFWCGLQEALRRCRSNPVYNII